MNAINDLHIPETSFTPLIDFQYSQGKLAIIGRSLPEDAEGFYQKVLTSLKDYFRTTKGPVSLLFKLDYFNTASAKIIVDLLFKVHDAIESGLNIDVKWFYEEEDDDMKDVASRFAEIAGIPLTTIAF